MVLHLCLLRCMKDNGRGMSHDDIPNMFGRGCVYAFDNFIITFVELFIPFLRFILLIMPMFFEFAVLSGTKYGLKQTRGKFGLGAKMVMFEADSTNLWVLHLSEQHALGI